MDRQQKKERIRENILEAILDLLRERSWESLSSNDICEAAKVSKRTLYVYFRSQDEIYLELVKRSFDEMTYGMKKAFSEGDTVLDKILNLGMAYLKFMLEEPVKGTLMIRFDEMRFVDTYPEHVLAISSAANQYELLNLFRQLDLEREVFNRTMAIYLWAHMQGIAQLIVSKKQWLEEYYGASTERLIEEQMIFIRQILKGVEK